jgi:hypothetical protein
MSKTATEYVKMLVALGLFFAAVSAFIAVLITQVVMPSFAKATNKSSQCSVITAPRLTAGTRCYTDEVMTGTSSDYILCSDLLVYCY